MKRCSAARKGFLWGLCAVVALIVGTSPAWALPIAGVTVESVSSEYVANGWDLSAIHTVDGSGLSGNPATHAQTVSPGGESWQTISQTGAAQIVFDLGGSYALTSMHIWNLNFYAPYNGRGAHEVALSLSPDLGSWDSKGNFSFSMATGLNGDPGFDISLQQPWETARYVKFDILSNWGGSDNAGHVGLSEVQFFSDTPDPAPVPEPATMLFLGLGLIGLAGAKKSLKINQDKSQ